MARRLIVPDAADGNDSQSPRSYSWSDYLSLSKSSGTRANPVSQPAETFSCPGNPEPFLVVCGNVNLITIRRSIVGLCSLCFDTLRMVWRYNKPPTAWTLFRNLGMWVALYDVLCTFALRRADFASDCNIHLCIATASFQIPCVSVIQYITIFHTSLKTDIFHIILMVNYRRHMSIRNIIKAKKHFPVCYIICLL